MATPIAGIYALEPFSTENPTPEEQATIATDMGYLAASGFGMVVFASFHVHDAGDIFFNDTQIANDGKVTSFLDPNLPSLISKLKTNGKVQTTLISLGGGGCFKGNSVAVLDFKAIRNLLEQYPNAADNPFFQNLEVLMRTYHIDGVDLDLEVYEGNVGCLNYEAATYAEFQDTMLAIIHWCTQKGFLVTAAPYQRPDFWAGLLAAAYAQNGNVQPVAWFNLQSEGEDSSVGSKFINAIRSVECGIADAPGFLSAGLQVTTMVSPVMVQNALAAYPGAGGGQRGGWLWNFGQIDPKDAASFASAIVKGLSVSH